MGRIPDETIRSVKEASDIVAVVETYIPLKQAGANLKACCPFHEEKTPSFNVHAREQYFKCFGCGEGGDVIKFVMLYERLSYPEAIETLAERAGIQIIREVGEARPVEKDTESKKALFWANQIAATYYEEMLAEQRTGKAAREYLLERGFTPQTLTDWSLGWAPDRWDGLLERLVREAGAERREKTIEVGINAGVLRYNAEKGSTYDAFRGRVMFPIFDAQQRVAGFGGRVLDEASTPGGKYINTSEGKLFTKRKLVYGLNFAAKPIGLARTAVIVEGYTDTIMCHQYGIRNVVATLGTALTTDHIRMLKRYIQQDGKVIAFFDADSAGEKATDRACDLFAEEDVTLKVAQGLAVKDAGEFLPKFGAEAFSTVLNEAEDAFDYRLRRAFAAGDGQSVSDRSRALEVAMAYVYRSPNRLKQEMMRQKVAAAGGVSVDSLPVQTPTQPRRETPRTRGLRTSTNAAPLPPPAMYLPDTNTAREQRERLLIRYMWEQQSWCALVMKEYPPDDFFTSAEAEIATLIRDAWDGGKRPELSELMSQVATEGADTVLVKVLTGDDNRPLSEAELNEILFHLRCSGLREEQVDLNHELGRSGLSDDRYIQVAERLREIELALRPQMTKSK